MYIYKYIYIHNINNIIYIPVYPIYIVTFTYKQHFEVRVTRFTRESRPSKSHRPEVWRLPRWLWPRTPRAGRLRSHGRWTWPWRGPPLQPLRTAAGLWRRRLRRRRLRWGITTWLGKRPGSHQRQDLLLQSCHQ